VTNAVLEFTNVVKRFGDALIVDGISFSVARGEFFTLLGPSGCGKTTTLRLLAGLEDPDAGEVGELERAAALGLLITAIVCAMMLAGRRLDLQLSGPQRIVTGAANTAAAQKR